jgi:DeoR/GlpR family transcriptional regulator of sugar metabolism
VTEEISSSAIDRTPLTSRREAVRARIIRDGFARIDELAHEFDVSVMTMHRDLDALAAEGWITKIRGGATANPSALLETGVRERAAAQRAEKAAIAQAAADLLGRGQTVFLDDSTTALALVPHLIAHAPITVASNFLPVVTGLAGAPGVELNLLGGQYNSLLEACFGLQTVDAIGRLHADVFFMSTTGLSGGRCYHRSEPTIMIRNAYLAASSRSVLLVDHAKFGRPASHLLCPVDRFDTVITDDGVDPEDLAALRERCDDVRVAPAR